MDADTIQKYVQQLLSIVSIPITKSNLIEIGYDVITSLQNLAVSSASDREAILLATISQLINMDKDLTDTQKSELDELIVLILPPLAKIVQELANKCSCLKCSC